MADLRLFDPPGPADPPAEASATVKLTERNRRSLANGRHPATGHRLLDPEWGWTCRDCRHAVHVEGGNRRYWKCARHRLGMSRSATSDIRVSWPACTLLTIDAQPVEVTRG